MTKLLLKLTTELWFHPLDDADISLCITDGNDDVLGEHTFSFDEMLRQIEENEHWEAEEKEDCKAKIAARMREFLKKLETRNDESDN